MKEPENCLGISLGMQRMGLAIGTAAELIESQVKFFDDRYTEGKINRIVRVVERIIIRYGISGIAIKAPRKVSRSKELNSAIDLLTLLAMSYDIQIVMYDVNMLEERFIRSVNKNKKKLASALLHTFPELKRYYSKIDSGKGVYYLKLFEAVAAMKLFSESLEHIADPL